ncbi:hypothetical protein SAMN06269185_1996 [Natronoarchaeum philippinense]|uniref:Uncharacterized protein n=1 Tax=Natronoarchaeum philippinense TaxID=558529 RepID=A0A285NZ99_NATPI|nr:hypothetical protein [Natronoarchaeum philippinense]SNZ12961.1 hypothetical protein SAMN06269185_1996 [Natronoarchaeum philippinense]
MFDSPADAWYVWIGLSLLGASLVGIVAQLPDGPPPDAAGPANAVDAVAGSRHTGTGTYPLSADAVRIESDRIGVRSGDEAAFETLAYGPVTPVREGTMLWELLRGARPDHVFESPEAFDEALDRARARDPSWRVSPDRLSVRTVSWDDIDATLVGA